MIGEELTPADPTLLRQRRTKRRVVIIFSTLLALAITAVAYLTLVVLPPAREQASRPRCQKQLRAIGQAMMLYANENHGKFPRDLGQVLITQDCTSSIFVCPSSEDRPARGADPKATAAELLTEGHCSYVYVGNSALHWPMPDTLVLAYERPGHHPTGSHILFGDLHVEMVAPDITAKIIAEVKAGNNPPRDAKIR